MGWASGSKIARRVIESAVANFPDSERRCRFYLDFLDAMFEADWDTESEVIGLDPAFDEAIEDLQPGTVKCTECGERWSDCECDA